MAQIYQKTVSDKTCILSPREFILRPFDFGDDWTEMRFGFYFSVVTSGGDNTDATVETVALTTAADRVTVGIKDSATNDLPGFGAALFLGETTYSTGATISIGGNTDIGTTSSNLLAATGYYATTLVGGAAGQSLGNPMSSPTAASGATGYCGFHAIKFVITNRGAATQSVAISTTSTVTVAGTDYSAQALRLLINNATFSTPVATAWNDGAVARDIPDAIFIRMPFYSNRIRLSAIRAIRYAP